jgi:hypothetical protein
MDRPLTASIAPAADVDDPGNRLDTDATALAILEHNSRYRAACPSVDR